MDDFLQESPSGAEFDLNELVAQQPVSTPIPVGTKRNRAATSAFLSGEPDKMIEKYRLMMQEESEGRTVTYDEVMKNMEEQDRTKAMKYVIPILGDKSIPLEQKKRLMDFVQKGQFKQEPAQALRTKGLEGPSPGEDVKGESARISLADSMQGIEQEAQERQRMVNGLVASHPDADLGTVGDIAATEVMPFGRNVIAAKVGKKLDELNGKDFSLPSFIKRFLLPGTAKADVQSYLMNIPPAQRGEVTQKIVSAVKDSASVFPSDNYYAQYSTAVRLLDSPTHSDTEVWAENLMTVLDAFWVGSEVKALGALGKTAAPVFDTSKARRPGSANPGVSDAENVVEKAEWELVGDPYNPNQIGPQRPRIEYKRADAQKRIELNSVVRRENPVAPYNVIEQVNPASARALHEAIVQGTDEVAEALTGVSREQAIANNIFPQIGTETGSVLNKVDVAIVEQVQNTGALRYTPEEFDSAVNVIKNDFRNASNLQINDAMTTFRVDGDHIVIDGHYSTPGGAFVTPEAAKAQAMLSLRKYGIREDEIVVMKRDGMDYTPVVSETEPGDYIIKVQTKLPVDDGQVAIWNPLDVKRNWSDRLSQTASQEKGHVSGWMFDPGSMLHPTLTGSAAVAADQAVVLENMLLRPIRDFRNRVVNMKMDRRMMMDDYIFEANEKGIKFDRFNLHARGFDEAEIDTLEQWKEIWDNHFYLENFDMVRTLRSQGYQVFDNGQTKLFGKPVPKNQNIENVYDPMNDTVRNLPVHEMDSLYNQGGSYVKLRRPVEMNGQMVEHMMVRNNASEFMRGIRDTDQILNYRHGYYTVNYNKGSKFVDEIVTDSTGAETRRTVGVAGSTKDAETWAKAQEASTGNKHVIREDSRGFSKDGDGYWDVSNAAGRIAQRLRGKPLVDAKGMNQIGTGTFVDTPLDSASRAARSISGRTVTRPVLETAKKRFIQQYGDMLPSDGMGGKRFPNHISEIVDHTSHTSKAVSDARTTYGYINYLQNGYINSADELFKGAMHGVANLLTKMPAAERAALKMAHISPTQAAKSVVFNAYIVGSNPIRQWIVQSHQATRMAAYNPKGFFSGAIHKRMVGYVGGYSGFKQDAAMDAFIKFVDDSGMVAGVDRNSLVRGLGMELTERSYTATKVAGGVRDVAQTIGFDIGEKLNQLGHLAAVYDKYARKGLNLADKTVRDQALAEARALSYDLNRAGELTYTQSTPAMILQFLQMPHKGWLQLTNRKIPVADRFKLFAYDLIMYGVGGGLLYNGISALWTAIGENGDDLLPDDPETRDKFVYGMESFILNKALTMIDPEGKQSRIDFGALASNDMEGWARMYHALFDDGVYAALAASPAGQLFAVDGVMGATRDGRIPKAILSMGRYMNVVEEFDPSNPTEFADVLNDVAKIASGWTAWQNARLMLETRKKLDAAGSTIDGDVTIPEIWAAGLGFGTLATRELYQIGRRRSEDKKRHEKELQSQYRDIMNYCRDNTTLEKYEHTVCVTSMLMRSFDPLDRATVRGWWQRDMVGKEVGLLKQVLEASGIPDSRKLEDDIKMMPNVDEQTKAQLLQRIKDVRRLNDKNKEEN